MRSILNIPFARPVIGAFVTAMISLGGAAAGQPASSPSPNGIFYGDGDYLRYPSIPYSTSVGGSDLYVVLVDTTLHVALVVDRRVNDNVFSDDRDYTRSVGWGPPRSARRLIDSEFAEFTLTVGTGTGETTWTWQQGYAGGTGPLGDDFTNENWVSDTTVSGGAGTPPPGVVSSSSLAWNMSNYAARVNNGIDPGWNMGTAGNSNSWTSPITNPSDPTNVINAGEGYPGPSGNPPVGSAAITYSPTYEWEWAMVYEWAVDLSQFTDIPTFVVVGKSHHSPAKNGTEDDPFPEPGPDGPAPLLDFGDLPSPYPTLLPTGARQSSDGARHAVDPNGVRLGTQLDTEADGQPQAAALGDDLSSIDDDDGIVALTPFVPGSRGVVQVTIGKSAGYLSAFADFNGDGILTPINLHSAAGPAAVSAGTLSDTHFSSPGIYELTIDIPANVTGLMPSRWRVTNASGQGGALTSGLASTGELEDYMQATLTGRVWGDTSKDGLQDAGEAGLDGVTVRLVNPDGSPVLDGNNQPVQKLTAGGGLYTFPGIPPGTAYRVEFVAPQGLAFAPQNADGNGLEGTGNSDANASGQTETFTIDQGTTLAGIDAGLFEDIGTLTGKVFHDLNSDGNLDPGEPAIQDIVVYTTDTLGVLHQVLTDTNGDFSIDLPSGAAIVAVEQKDPRLFIGAALTTGNGSQNVNVLLNQIISATPFGFGLDPAVCALDWATIYDPADYFGGYPSDGPTTPTQNGRSALSDASFPVGTGSIDIKLGNAYMLNNNPGTDNLLEHPRILAENRSFGYGTNVPPYLFLQKTLSGAEGRVDDLYFTMEFPYVNGASDVNFIVYDIDRNSASASFTRWIDQLEIYGETTSGVTVLPTITRVGSTEKVFVNGNVSEGLTAASDTNSPTLADGANIAVDFGSAQLTSLTLVYKVKNPPLTQVAGDYPYGNQGIGLSRFEFTGCSEPSYASITGQVFNDANGNGLWDGGEPSIPNVDVLITGGFGEITVVSTDASGRYTARVTPGVLEIDVDTTDPDMLPGAFLTTSNEPQTVLINDDESLVADMIGYQQRNGELSGIIWNDLDNSFTAETGEPRYTTNGVDLDWSGPDGIFGNADDDALSTTTDGTGRYTFTGLPAGTFRVSVNDAGFPETLIITNKTNPFDVALAAGEQSLNNDVAYSALTIEKYDAVLWADLDEDGNVDVGDTVTFEIELTNPSLTTAATVDLIDPLPIGLGALDILAAAGGDVSASSPTELVVKNIPISADSSISVICTAVVLDSATAGSTITNVAQLDADGDGTGDVSDSGDTDIVIDPTVFSPDCGDTFIMNTIVGNGYGGFVGEGVPSTDAQLFFPLQACVDVDGNVFIADTSNHLVRRIDNTTGIITTVAGMPNDRGYSGDGGLATDARLALPSDVFVRGTDMYIADKGNNVIRKVDLLTGIITTVAGNGVEGYSGDGGLATAVSLNRPRGVFVDVAGNIYIADTFNFSIRVVSAADGTISTILGQGTHGHSPDGTLASDAFVEWILDIAVSSDGTVYFPEANGYNIVRRIVNDRLETIVGQAGAADLGDCGLASQAYLRRPAAIALDAFDNVYIADTENHRVRVYNQRTGKVIPVAGTGVAGFNGDGVPGVLSQLDMPTGLAISATGLLYVVDSANHRLRVMDTTEPVRLSDYLEEFPGIDAGESGIIAGYGTWGFNGDGPDSRSAQLNHPGRIAIDADGSIILADRSNHRIRKITRDWQIVTIAGTGERGASGDGADARFAQLNFPTDLAIAADGTIYFTDEFNHAIRAIAADNTISTIAGTLGTAGFAGDGGPATAAQLNRPDGITISGNTLYISDKENQRIRTIDVTTGIINTIAGNGSFGFGFDGTAAVETPLASPRGIAIDPIDGSVVWAEMGSQRVRKLSGGVISTVAGLGLWGYDGDGGLATEATMRHPIDVEFLPTGDLYIAEHSNHVVRKVDRTTSTISTVLGTGNAGYTTTNGQAVDQTDLNKPYGLAFDPQGNLFVTEYLNHVLRVGRY